MKKIITFIPFLLIWPSFVFAFDHSHTAYDQLLKDIVIPHGHQSYVDYRKLKADPDRLYRFVNDIESVNKNDFQSWNKDQQLAFLINAYNALTLKLVILHYPGIHSIRDAGGFFTGPWKLKFFKFFGEDSYLDHIEHDLMRKDFSEPRIHFAINCASRGCPALQPEAYIADKLDQQLEHAARSFLMDAERNRYDKDRDLLEISSLFKWFKHDFEQAAGSIETFIAPYITDEAGLRIRLIEQAIKIRFLDYDWSLNDAANSRQ
jgi:hypothetical protein